MTFRDAHCRAEAGPYASFVPAERRVSGRNQAFKLYLSLRGRERSKMLRFLHVLACLVVLVNAVPLEKTLHFSAQSENAVVETAGAAGDPVKTRVSTHSLILDHGSARKKIEVRITKDFIKKHVPVMIPVSTTPLPAPVSEKPHLLPAHTHEHATAAPPHIHAHERIAGTNTRPVVTPALAHSHEHLRDASVHHGGHIHITPIHSHERAAAEPVHPQEHVSAPSHPHGHDHATLIRAPAHVIATPGHSHAHTTAVPLPPIVKSHEESPIVINNGTLSGILRKLLAGDIKSAHLSGKQVVKDLAGKSVAVVISASMHVVDLGDLQSPGSSHVAISHFGHNDSSLLASVLKPLAALAHLKGHVFVGAKHHKSCAAKTSHLLPGIVVLSTPKPSVTTPSSATKQEQTPPKIIPAKTKLPEGQLPAGDQTSSVPPPAEVLPTAADPY